MKKNNTVKSLMWKTTEKMGSQGANFVITIILARLLGPSEYGVVALLSIFITFATVMVQEGFNTALIRRKQIDNDEYLSSLLFSILIAIVLYIILFFTSPFISKFYEMKNLDKMLRVLSIVLFPAAVNSVQTAYLTKKFKFKQMCISNLSATIIAGIISIYAAFIGMKAWALVLNQLLYQIFSCTFIWFFCKWRPEGKFSIKKLKNVVGFGSKMLFTSLLINLFLNIRSLLIGKYYSSKDLGFFNRGKSFSSTVMDGINGSIQAVLLPTYSNLQENIIELKNNLRKSINITCYVIFPALIGLACISEPMVKLILGDEWINAIPYVQLFAITYIFQPTQIATAQALKAIEKGNVILTIEILRKSFELILLFSVLFKGPVYIAFTGIIAGLFAIIVTFIPNKKHLLYTYREQVVDFVKPLFESLIMGSLIILFNKYTDFSNIITLLIDVIIGVSLYILISVITKNTNFIFLKNLIIKKNKDE